MGKVAWFACVLAVASLASAQATRPASNPSGGSIFDFGRDGTGANNGAARPESAAKPAATQPAAPADAEPAKQPYLLTITATIDGSDELVLSATGAVWTHKFWDWPTDVSLNEVTWDPQAQPNLTSEELKFLKRADFSKARVLDRRGRDTVGMEREDDHITIHFADCPNGTAEYRIRVLLPPK
jgi:hypothetical protein